MPPLLPSERQRIFVEIFQVPSHIWRPLAFIVCGARTTFFSNETISNFGRELWDKTEIQRSQICDTSCPVLIVQ